MSAIASKRADRMKLAEAALRNLHIDCAVKSEPPQRFASRLLLLAHDGLIIEAPAYQGQLVQLTPGQEVSCSCRLGREILRFTARVIDWTTHRLNAQMTVPSLRLTVPTSLTLVQRRRYYRVSLLGRHPVDVTLWVVEADHSGSVQVRQEFHGHIADISAGGFGLLIRDPALLTVAEGRQLWARFMLPEENESLIFRVAVAHSRFIQPSGLYRAGLEIVEYIEPGEHAAVIDKLARFVTRLERARLNRLGGR